MKFRFPHISKAKLATFFKNIAICFFGFAMGFILTAIFDKPPCKDLSDGTMSISSGHDVDVLECLDKSVKSRLLRTFSLFF